MRRRRRATLPDLVVGVFAIGLSAMGLAAVLACRWVRNKSRSLRREDGNVGK